MNPPQSRDLGERVQAIQRDEEMPKDDDEGGPEERSRAHHRTGAARDKLNGHSCYSKARPIQRRVTQGAGEEEA